MDLLNVQSMEIEKQNSIRKDAQMLNYHRKNIITDIRDHEKSRKGSRLKQRLQRTEYEKIKCMFRDTTSNINTDYQDIET